MDSFYKCDLCQTSYVFDMKEEGEGGASKCRFYSLVARDCFAVFLALNLVVILCGLAIEGIFQPKDEIINRFSATRWMSEHWNKHLVDFIVIYVCGGLFVLFYLGIMGICYAMYKGCMWCLDIEDSGPETTLHQRSRSYPYRRSRSSVRCDGCYWVYCSNRSYSGSYTRDPYIGGCDCCIDLCQCCAASSDGCSGSSSSDCGNSNCSSGSSSSDDGAALLVIAVVIVVIIIIVGLFVAVLLLTALFSKIVQRRVRVLNMRERCKTYVVRDLAIPHGPSQGVIPPVPERFQNSSISTDMEDQPLLKSAPPPSY